MTALPQSRYDYLREDARSNFTGPFLPHPWLPQEIDDVLMMFPGDIGHLMPDPRDIPDQDWQGTEWTEFAQTWFGVGVDDSTQVAMKDGVDMRTAFRHLRAILGSFQPKHEHKIAAAGFLLANWIDCIVTPDRVYGTAPGDGH